MNETNVTINGLSIRLICLSAILIVTLMGASAWLTIREYGLHFGPMAHVEAQKEATLWVAKMNGDQLERLQRAPTRKDDIIR